MSVRKQAAWCRCPSHLTILVVLAGLFVLTSHHIFQPSLGTRSIRRAPTPQTRPLLVVESADSVSALDSWEPLPHSLQQPGPMNVESRVQAFRAAPEATPLTGGLPMQALLASRDLVPYNEEVDEFNCTPMAHVARPSRPLDYVVSPSSATWPQNCEGREDLCDVLRTTAIDREVLVAVCNSAVTGQLSKWVDANRRAKVLSHRANVIAVRVVAAILRGAMELFLVGRRISLELPCAGDQHHDCGYRRQVPNVAQQE